MVLSNGLAMLLFPQGLAYVKLWDCNDCTLHRMPAPVGLTLSAAESSHCPVMVP